MDTTPDDSADPTRSAFRDFALACRVERDRRAEAELAEADHRFETSLADRHLADLFATRLIAAVAGKS